MEIYLAELLWGLNKQPALHLTQSSYLISNISLFFIIVIITALSCIFGHLEEVTPICFKQLKVPSLFNLQEIQWWPWRFAGQTSSISVRKAVQVFLWVWVSDCMHQNSPGSFFNMLIPVPCSHLLNPISWGRRVPSASTLLTGFPGNFHFHVH